MFDFNLLKVTSAEKTSTCEVIVHQPARNTISPPPVNDADVSESPTITQEGVSCRRETARRLILIIISNILRIQSAKVA